MNEIPSMWRTELFHPQFVHFTVALLMVGSLLWLLGFVLPESQKAFLSKAGQLLIIGGSALTWGTIYTGSLADSEVVRTLCDPTVLEDHEHKSYTMAYIFSGISLLMLINQFTTWLKRFQSLVYGFLVIGLLVGNGYLAYTAHLGAKIVYQQGGGVYEPSEDCEEFED
jgi:uncharacterized membrane protein